MPILDFENTTNTNNRIKVIGVGGGGGNAVANMFKEGIAEVDFIIVNTDAQMLKHSPVPVKIQVGETGLGAGNRPQVGKEAALESVDKIKELLDGNTDMVFVTAGMGGGTGTGAAPVIASIARELGILTVGIVTQPFTFEGPKRIKQAEAGIEELRKFVDTIIVIVNDKIREIYQDMKFSEGFKIADNILTTAAKGIAELITLPGYINVDFEDVKQIMKDGGKALMTSGSAAGEDRALQCCEKALTSPLIDDNSINGAENILLNIACSREHEMSMNELTDITDYIKEISGVKSDVIWGSCYDDDLGDVLKVTIIATGFDKQKNENHTPKSEVIELYNVDKNEVKKSEKTANDHPDFVRISEKRETVTTTTSTYDVTENKMEKSNSNRIVIPLIDDEDNQCVDEDESKEINDSIVNNYDDNEQAFSSEQFERINKINNVEEREELPKANSNNQSTAKQLEIGNFSFGSEEVEEDDHFKLMQRKAKERLQVRISKKDENSNKDFVIERISSDKESKLIKNERETLYSEETYTSKESVEYDEENNEIVIKENNRYIDKRED